MQKGSGWTFKNTNLDTAIRQKPISFINASQYIYLNGNIGNWIGANTYWYSGAANAAHAMVLYFNSTYLNPQEGNYKGFGFSLRCLGR